MWHIIEYICTKIKIDVFIRKPSKSFNKLRFGRRRIELHPRSRRIQKSNNTSAQTNQSYLSYSWLRNEKKGNKKRSVLKFSLEMILNELFLKLLWKSLTINSRKGRVPAARLICQQNEEISNVLLTSQTSHSIFRPSRHRHTSRRSSSKKQAASSSFCSKKLYCLHLSPKAAKTYSHPLNEHNSLP